MSADDSSSVAGTQVLPPPPVLKREYSINLCDDSDSDVELIEKIEKEVIESDDEKPKKKNKKRKRVIESDDEEEEKKEEPKKKKTDKKKKKKAKIPDAPSLIDDDDAPELIDEKIEEEPPTKKKKKDSVKHMKWFCTLWNKEGDKTDYLALAEKKLAELKAKGLPDKVRYIRAVREKGDESDNREHMHIAVWFKETRGMTYIQNLFGASHMNCQKIISDEGTMNYIGKDETRIGEVIEVGSKVLKPGKRNDLIAMEAWCKENTHLGEDWEAEFRDAFPGVAASQNIIYVTRLMHKLQAELNKNDRPLEVWWLYGDAGALKTTYAVQTLEKKFGKRPWLSNPANVMGGANWFDGYAQHKGVVFDDNIPTLDQVKRYCQPIGAQVVPVKGSFVPWVAEHIIFTANLSVGDVIAMWKLEEENAEAFRRRIHKVVEFRKVGSEWWKTASDEEKEEFRKYKDTIYYRVIKNVKPDYSYLKEQLQDLDFGEEKDELNESTKKDKKKRLEKQQQQEIEKWKRTKGKDRSDEIRANITGVAAEMIEEEEEE